jgi:hypothetical protein
MSKMIPSGNATNSKGTGVERLAEDMERRKIREANRYQAVPGYVESMTPEGQKFVRGQGKGGRRTRRSRIAKRTKRSRRARKTRRR